MTRRTPAPPPDDDADLDPSDELDETLADGSPGPDLSSLPIAGITRRRIGFLAGALVSVWIVIVFARQVGEASAATARVDDLRAANAELAGRLAALEREAELIQRQEWIEQQARGYRLGSGGEIPFALGDAEALPPDAPGSAAVRLGADERLPTPLESWLSLLFGPSG
jgi:hypothetical protein